MKSTWWALLLNGWWLCGTAQAVTIEYHVQDLGNDSFRIQYDVEPVAFDENQELEIRFHPALYRNLSNPLVSLGFDVLLFQPDDPPGADGRFSALALVDIPAVSHTFAVDVRMQAGYVPGVQEFAINQLDARGLVLETVVSGHTSVPTPEPSALPLIGAVLLIARASPAWRRRLSHTN